MRPLTISLLLALLTLISALPSPAPLTPRKNYCHNVPNTPAGTKLTRTPGSFHSVDVGTNTMTWCDRHSATYIIVSIAYSLPGGGLGSLLEAVSMACVGHVQQSADGPIPTGELSYLIPQRGATVAMHAWSTNNHQLTYGVLGAAIRTLKEYFDSTEWGAATMQIWDGVNEVGMAVVGLQPNGNRDDFFT